MSCFNKRCLLPQNKCFSGDKAQVREATANMKDLWKWFKRRADSVKYQSQGEAKSYRWQEVWGFCRANLKRPLLSARCLVKLRWTIPQKSTETTTSRPSPRQCCCFSGGCLTALDCVSLGAWFLCSWAQLISFYRVMLTRWVETCCSLVGEPRSYIRWNNQSIKLCTLTADTGQHSVLGREASPPTQREGIQFSVLSNVDMHHELLLSFKSSQYDFQFILAGKGTWMPTHALAWPCPAQLSTSSCSSCGQVSRARGGVLKEWGAGTYSTLFPRFQGVISCSP